MRFGGPLLDKWDGPEDWARRVRELGFAAAYCPLGSEAGDGEVASYAAAAKRAGLVIAEVGAWSNPLSRDEPTRLAAVAKCKACLALAERIGARCCVNIAGSRGPSWHGPDAADLTDETFDMIVQVVREIIDAVRPTCTAYALETMPWLYPDSADSYLRLIAAIDRPGFAAHFDPENLVCSPQAYFRNGEIIRDFCRRLGPHIRSCHAKDVTLSNTLTVHLDEIRPGLGNLDYRTFLTELDKLDADTPLMMEHLATAADYALAAEHIRSVAAEAGVEFRPA
jgi:sugar phosphate isomerase/epimerase